MATGTEKIVRATSAYCTEMHPCAQVVSKLCGGKQRFRKLSDF